MKEPADVTRAENALRGFISGAGECGDLDLVCNEFVLAEQQKGLKKVSRNSSALLRGWLMSVCYIPVLAMGVGAFWAFLSWNYLLALFCAVVAVVVHYSSFSGLKGFPTNVRVKQLGISFAWRTQNIVDSFVIPWEGIEHIDAYRDQAAVPTQPFKGVSVRIRYRQSFIGEKARKLRQQLYTLWKSPVPYGTVNGHLDKDTVEIEFPLDSLTLDADKYRLVSAIKERAPAPALGPAFLQLSETNDAPAFTQLWLDDMQSFRRQRVQELEPGANLNDNRYRVIEKIATGGQAKIYRGVDVVTSSAVAIKELILPINAGAEVRNRSFANVRTEAMLLGSLDHPNIVKLLDNFVEDHRAYLILEHVTGKTLRGIVQDGYTLSVAQVCEIGIKMCSFLDYLHSQSPPIIHRDLTPDNVMYGIDGQIKLLDFNVAKQLESGSTKTIVGKHNYMAPEQFRGHPDTQSDLYSLGCTLFYLLVGVDPVPLSCSHPAAKSVIVPPELDVIVARLTCLDLQERYKTATEVADGLQRVLAVCSDVGALK